MRTQHIQHAVELPAEKAEEKEILIMIFFTGAKI